MRRLLLAIAALAASLVVIAPATADGPTPAQLLYPYALALYLAEIDLYPWHRDPYCIVPSWLPPSAP